MTTLSKRAPSQLYMRVFATTRPGLPKRPSFTTPGRIARPNSRVDARPKGPFSSKTNENFAWCYRMLQVEPLRRERFLEYTQVGIRSIANEIKKKRRNIKKTEMMRAALFYYWNRVVIKEAGGSIARGNSWPDNFKVIWCIWFIQCMVHAACRSYYNRRPCLMMFFFIVFLRCCS